MTQSKVRSAVTGSLVTLLVLAVKAGVVQAQSRADCSTPTPLGLGVSAGRSSPYFDLTRAAVDGGGNGSILVRDGGHLAGRVDVPIAGPWRARLEGSMAHWRVERQTYGADFQLSATETVGHVEARQLVALAGRQGGRSVACGYVLAGGGLYSLDYRGASLRRPGVAFTAGVEVPAGRHGAVQLDVQLHVIDTRARYPIANSKVLASSLSVSWKHRF